MFCSITIARYPKHLGVAGIFSMAFFHVPLFLGKHIGFYKLMGSGKNGSFDKRPDWLQWAVFAVHPTENIQLPAFLRKWFRFFNAEVCTLVLQPIEGHGTWDGKEIFGNLPKQTAYNGPIAILTRATIKISKLKSFWQNVPPVSNQMANAAGLRWSIGIGEIPFIKQATFSIWESKDAMKNFAYNMKEHTQVIRKTRQENWYSEEMFVRFIPLKVTGTINGTNPLDGKA